MGGGGGGRALFPCRLCNGFLFHTDAAQGRGHADRLGNGLLLTSTAEVLCSRRAVDADGGGCP